jgi:glycosyltransferase involved in cell wall biosynthesis
MNKGQFPLVTVGTLCYNTGVYVIEALECVQKQNYPNIQHIIIEDCSTDNSASMVEQWVTLNGYSCQLIKHDVNKGVHYGLKEIFDLAEGKYLMMISDDLWTSNKMVDMVSIFENLDDSYAMVYGDTQVIDKNGKVIVESIFEAARGKDFEPPSGYIFAEILKDFYFYIQASIIRLEHFRSIGYSFDPQIISEDWDWKLALSRNFKIYGQKKIYASYRSLEKSVTRTNWTKNRMKMVLLSQAKMVLNYYAHRLNNDNDNDMIFQRVVRFYEQLIVLHNFSFKDHINFALYFFKSTKRVSVVFYFMQMVIKRISFRINLSKRLKSVV